MTGPTHEIAPDVHMPLLGLGTYLLDEGAECTRAVATALEAGYRHIDTAWMYDNERSVGRALRDSGVQREEVFVTTKLWNTRQGADTRPAFEESLENLGLSYIDLYLIHWPHIGDGASAPSMEPSDGSRDRERGLGRSVGKGTRPIAAAWEQSWETMQSFVEEGLARAVGVSNFLVPHLERLEQLGLPMPANDQIELHPFLYAKRRDVLDRCERDGISITAYSPLTRGRRFDHPAVRAVADEHGATSAQVLIAWGLAHGYASIPKSANPDRIRENAGALDVDLDRDDLAALDRLDETLVVSWNPDRTV
ncbi:MAG: aldo/keto reductase [Actinobacteria bacterium]|nr:aldo/keto reductase [Actinomycetota bacterium]